MAQISFRQPEIREAAAPKITENNTRPPVQLHSFEDIVACAGERRELMIKVELEDKVRLVRFEPQKLVINPLPRASKTLIKDLGEKLAEWTGQTWFVTTSDEEGLAPLSQRRRDAAAAEVEAVKDHPLVKQALELFPTAEIKEVRRKEEMPDEADGKTKSRK